MTQLPSRVQQSPRRLLSGIVLVIVIFVVPSVGFAYVLLQGRSRVTGLADSTSAPRETARSKKTQITSVVESTEPVRVGTPFGRPPEPKDLPVAVARDDRRKADVDSPWLPPALPVPSSISENVWTKIWNSTRNRPELIEDRRPPIHVGSKSEKETVPLPPLPTVDIATIESKAPPIPPPPPASVGEWSRPTGGPELLPAPTITPRTLPREPAFVLGDPRLRHWEELHCVAWSPDGKTLAGGGGSRGLAVVRLWDPDKQTEQEVLRVETESTKDAHGVVVSLVFAADGKRLAGRCDTGDVCLWIIANGRSALCAKLAGDSCSPVSFSPDGKTLAVSCANDRVQLWDIDRRKPTVCDVLKGGQGTINDLTFSRDGKQLTANYEKGNPRTWNLADCSGKNLSADATRTILASNIADSADGNRRARVYKWERQIYLSSLVESDCAFATPGQPIEDPVRITSGRPFHRVLAVSLHAFPTLASAVSLTQSDSLATIDEDGILSTWSMAANGSPKNTGKLT